MPAKGPIPNTAACLHQWKFQVFRHHCKHDQPPFFPYLRIRDKERKNEMLLLVLLETMKKTGA